MKFRQKTKDYIYLVELILQDIRESTYKHVWWPMFLIFWRWPRLEGLSATLNYCFLAKVRTSLQQGHCEYVRLSYLTTFDCWMVMELEILTRTLNMQKCRKRKMWGRGSSFNIRSRRPPVKSWENRCCEARLRAAAAPLVQTAGNQAVPPLTWCPGHRILSWPHISSNSYFSNGVWKKITTVSVTLEHISQLLWRTDKNKKYPIIPCWH